MMQIYKWRKYRKLAELSLGLVCVYFVSRSLLFLFLTPSRSDWLPRLRVSSTRTGKQYVRLYSAMRSSLNRSQKILLWNPFFKDPLWSLRDLSTAFNECPVNNCVLTNDKSSINDSDAVVFHAMDLWNKFLGSTLPSSTFRKPEQVWILVNYEPPPNVPLNFQKFANVFNWTMSYRKDSTVVVRYYEQHLPSKNVTIPDVAASKTAGIAWVASNCGDDARRQMIVRELDKYIKVDTFGKCGEKTLLTDDNDKELGKYKFYLSLENSYCRDYVTEKFFEALSRYQIPIVAGGGNYTLVAPRHSYINIADFASMRELGDYIKTVDANNTLYNSYFKWTNKLRMTALKEWCVLCDALHDEKRPHQTYTDMESYQQDDTCQKWMASSYLYRMAQGYALRYGII